MSRSWACTWGSLRPTAKYVRNWFWNVWIGRTFLVRASQTCALSRPAQDAHWGLLASEFAQRPMQKIFIDYMGKLPRIKAGNTAILVCVDAFSNFVWLVPVREATTRMTIKVLNGTIFCSISVPEVLVWDIAPCFTSRKLRQFCFVLGIKHVTTSLYYPQPSHAVRFNKKLPAALITYHSESHTTWDRNVTLAPTWIQHVETWSHSCSSLFGDIPFRSNSPLINRSKVNDLLPEMWNKRMLKQRGPRLSQNPEESRAYMAKLTTEIGPLPLQVGKYGILTKSSGEPCRT